LDLQSTSNVRYFAVVQQKAVYYVLLSLRQYTPYLWVC
jgi:hypothetical protein